jgi:hypothetical protein
MLSPRIDEPLFPVPGRNFRKFLLFRFSIIEVPSQKVNSCKKWSFRAVRAAFLPLSIDFFRVGCYTDSDKEI